MAVPYSFAAQIEAAHPLTAKESIQVLNRTVSDYQGLKTVQGLLTFHQKTGMSKADLDFLRAKVETAKTEKLPRVVQDGLTLRFPDSDVPASVKFVSFDKGQVEINNGLVDLSSSDLRKNWNLIENALPKSHSASGFHLINEADAMGPLIIALLVFLAVRELYDIGMHEYAAHYIEKGQVACEQAAADPTFRSGPKSDAARTQMADLMKAVISFKPYLDKEKCMDWSMPDGEISRTFGQGYVTGFIRCDKRNALKKCMGDLESRYSQLQPTSALPATNSSGAGVPK